MWRKLLDAALVVGPRLLAVVFGVWFMVMPVVIGYSHTLAGMNDRLTGPILAGFAFLALSPTLRFLRWAELFAALWIFITPLFIRYEIDGNTLPEIIHLYRDGTFRDRLSRWKDRQELRRRMEFRPVVSEARSPRRALKCSEFFKIKGGTKWKSACERRRNAAGRRPTTKLAR